MSTLSSVALSSSPAAVEKPVPRCCLALLFRHEVTLRRSFRDGDNAFGPIAPSIRFRRIHNSLPPGILFSESATRVCLLVHAGPERRRADCSLRAAPIAFKSEGEYLSHPEAILNAGRRTPPHVVPARNGSNRPPAPRNQNI